LGLLTAVEYLSDLIKVPVGGPLNLAISLEVDRCPAGEVGCLLLEGKVDYPFNKVSAVRSKQDGDLTA
jgi:hypothetical protein